MMASVSTTTVQIGVGMSSVSSSSSSVTAPAPTSQLASSLTGITLNFNNNKPSVLQKQPYTRTTFSAPPRAHLRPQRPPRPPRLRPFHGSGFGSGSGVVVGSSSGFALSRAPMPMRVTTNAYLTASCSYSKPPPLRPVSESDLDLEAEEGEVELESSESAGTGASASASAGPLSNSSGGAFMYAMKESTAPLSISSKSGTVGKGSLSLNAIYEAANATRAAGQRPTGECIPELAKLGAAAMRGREKLRMRRMEGGGREGIPGVGVVRRHSVAVVEEEREDEERKRTESRVRAEEGDRVDVVSQRQSWAEESGGRTTSSRLGARRPMSAGASSSSPSSSSGIAADYRHSRNLRGSKTFRPSPLAGPSIVVTGPDFGEGGDGVGNERDGRSAGVGGNAGGSAVLATAAAESMRDDHDTRRGSVIGVVGVVETAAPRREMSSNITVSEEGEGEEALYPRRMHRSPSPVLLLTKSASMTATRGKGVFALRNLRLKRTRSTSSLKGKATIGNAKGGKGGFALLTRFGSFSGTGTRSGVGGVNPGYGSSPRLGKEIRLPPRAVTVTGERIPVVTRRVSGELSVRRSNRPVVYRSTSRFLEDMVTTPPGSPLQPLQLPSHPSSSSSSLTPSSTLSSSTVVSSSSTLLMPSQSSNPRRSSLRSPPNSRPSSSHRLSSVSTKAPIHSQSPSPTPTLHTYITNVDPASLQKHNWFTATPTPVFSRAGIWTQGVVMPVSKREVMRAKEREKGKARSVGGSGSEGAGHGEGEGEGAGVGVGVGEEQTGHVRPSSKGKDVQRPSRLRAKSTPTPTPARPLENGNEVPPIPEKSDRRERRVTWIDEGQGVEGGTGVSSSSQLRVMGILGAQEEDGSSGRGTHGDAGVSRGGAGVGVDVGLNRGEELSEESVGVTPGSVDGQHQDQARKWPVRSSSLRAVPVTASASSPSVLSTSNSHQGPRRSSSIHGSSVPRLEERGAAVPALPLLTVVNAEGSTHTDANGQQRPISESDLGGLRHTDTVVDLELDLSIRPDSTVLGSAESSEEDEDGRYRSLLSALESALKPFADEGVKEDLVLNDFTYKGDDELTNPPVQVLPIPTTTSEPSPPDSATEILTPISATTASSSSSTTSSYTVPSPDTISPRGRGLGSSPDSSATSLGLAPGLGVALTTASESVLGDAMDVEKGDLGVSVGVVTLSQSGKVSSGTSSASASSTTLSKTANSTRSRSQSRVRDTQTQTQTVQKRTQTTPARSRSTSSWKERLSIKRKNRVKEDVPPLPISIRNSGSGNGVVFPSSERVDKTSPDSVFMPERELGVLVAPRAAVTRDGATHVYAHTRTEHHQHQQQPRPQIHAQTRVRARTEPGRNVLVKGGGMRGSVYATGSGVGPRPASAAGSTLTKSLSLREKVVRAVGFGR